MKPTATLRHFLCLASSALLAISSAHAARIHWDANGATSGLTDGLGAWLGTGQWWDGTTNVDWSSYTAPDAVFGNGGAGGAVSLASPTTVGSLTFNYFTGTYTLGTAGQEITLNSGITKNAGAGVVTFSALSPIKLGAAQTFTNNSVTNLALGALNLNGNALTVTGTGITTFDGNAGNVISGAGGITKNGTGVLILDGGTSITHTFTGGISITGGSVRFQNATNVSGRGNVSINGGYLGGRFNSSPTFAGGLGTGTTAIQILGGVSGFSGEGGTGSTFTIGTAGSTLKWGATGENGATGFFNPTVLVLGGDQGMNTNAKGTLANAIDLNGTTRTITSLHANGDGAAGTGFTVSGAISNSAGTAAGLTKTGPGNIILTAANTYNGSTTINGGSITLSGTGTINNTTALNLGGGTLRMVNTANTQRFADVAVSASAGGGISYENTSGSVNYTESVGALTLTKGQVNVVLTTDQVSTGSQKLTFGISGTGNLTQSGGKGVVTFSAAGAGLNATKNTVAVFGATATPAGGIIGPWATVGTASNVQTSYAAYDASGFVVAAATTVAAVDTDLSSSTGNYDINTGSLFTLTGTRTVNAVQFRGATSTLDLATFKLETNGFFFSGGAGNGKTIAAGTGGALTTASGGGNLYITAGQVMTAGNEHKISAPITDNGGTVHLVKSGSGTLILSAANNTYGGDTIINAGTLQVGISGSAAQLNGGTYAGNIFIARGAALTLQGNSSNTLSGIISGDGNLNLNRGTTTLSGNNTYTGVTSMSLVATNALGSTLNVSSFNSVVGGTASSSLGAPTTVANGTIGFGGGGIQQTAQINYTGSGETTDRILNFQFNGTGTRVIDSSGAAASLLKFTSAPTSNGTTTGSITLQGTRNGEFSGGLPFGFTNLTKSGAGTWTLGGQVGHTGTTTISASGGILQIAGAGSFRGGNYSNTIALGAGGTLKYSSSANQTFAGVISGSGALIKDTDSTSLLNLSGANTYTGNTTLGAGTIRLGVAEVVNVSGPLGKQLANAAGTIIMNGGTLQHTAVNTSDYSGRFSTAASQAYNVDTNGQTVTWATALSSSGGTLTKSGTGTLNLTNSNGYSGATTISGGTLQIGNGGTTGSLSPSSTINNNATLAFNRSDTVTQGTHFANTIGGTGGVAQAGSGILVLGGTNGYLGGTTVSAGTLLINGNSSTATGAVAVNAGTLGGTGTVGGAITVDALATLAPGASIESLAAPSLIMQSTSIFAYEVADNSATGADLMALASTVSLTGVTLGLDPASLAALGGAGWSIGNKLTLISYLGADITSGFTGYADDTAYTFGSNSWLFDYNDTVAGGNYGADAVAGGQNRFVTMTVVPEPRAALIGGLGLLMLLRRRR